VFSQKLATVVLDVENELDKLSGRADELQNWMDIYMPLRLQHQISETIRECLPRRGKYLLGIVDQQMCNQLRERMFTDVGSPDLKERCLDVIKELKLEADVLTEGNLKTIGEAAANWKSEEAEERRKNNPVLAKVEQTGQAAGVGDADSEALGRL